MAKEPKNGPKRRQEQFIQERRSKLKPRESEEKGRGKNNRKDSSGVANKAQNGGQRIQEYRQRQRRKRDKDQPNPTRDRDNSKTLDERKEKTND